MISIKQLKIRQNITTIYKKYEQALYIFICLLISNIYYFAIFLLIEFNIAINATPTSANTASHIVAIPNAPNIKTIALTPKAKIIF